MSHISVKLPDGSEKILPEGATVFAVAESIGSRLAAAALAGKIDGALVDLSTPVPDGSTIEIVTDRSPEALHLLRHSTAHVMAQAVGDLFPGTQFGIGPDIEDGFYYDFELGRSLSPEDLSAIEERMSAIIAEARPFTRRVVCADEARSVLADQPMKLELLDELPEGEGITLYTQGDFVDLCRGPHLPDTGRIAAYKLTKTAGAYWRGDSDRPMLQRVYGTAWFSKKDLEEYLTRIEEAEKRDHRKIGRELDLFSFHEIAGPGLPLFHPKGARVIRTLQEWLRRDLYDRGYEEVMTPHIYKADVWKISGHYDFYNENMYFFDIDEGEGKMTEYAVKPMNCPGHVMIYGNELRSYRDLPMRLFEFGTVYRHELSGVVHGLMRARGFTQDDAHIFCTEEQVEQEVFDILNLVEHIMSTFGFEYTAEISTRPGKSIGSDAMWDHATQALQNAITRFGLEYEINEGDGAFYGPKIDIKVKDAIGRTWQCSTIQVDFNFPERFDLTYRTADNTEERPYVLHRAIFGSIERFLGILIEHYAGAFPTWLAPVQVAVIPIADRHLDYAHEVAKQLKAAGGRVEVSEDNEPMRVKIAKAQQSKIPYMLVVGDRDVESGEVSVRDRFEGDIGSMSVPAFVEKHLNERD